MRSRRLLVVAAALLGSAGTALAGQPATGPSGGPEAGVPAGPVREAAAAAAARLASLDLAVVPTLTLDDFAIAEHLLTVAHALDPANEGVLRRLMEAAASTGDAARVIDLSTELLRLSPGDTVAQLRLISARIGALQDADARLARYEAFLGPRGAAIDAAIRSRLALDAALLLRERGDFKAFADRLAQAVELDPTNKQAAALAAAFFSQRVDDPAGRLELLATLLQADPLDSSTHLALARELAGAGAYRGALRLYSTSQGIRSRIGERPDPLLVAEVQLALWLVAGPAPVVADMRESLLNSRQRTAEEAQRALAQGVPPEQIRRPEQILLQTPSAMVAVGAAASMGDAELLDWAFEEMKLATAAVMTQLKNDEDGARRVGAELLWLRLLAGRETEAAAQQIEALRRERSLNPDALARLEGWLLMRQGDAEAAEARLRPLSDADPLALLGLAVGADVAGDADAAVSWYAHVYHAAPGTLAAAYAASRHALLREEPPPPAELATRMEAVAREAIPDWAERFASDPRAFMTIEVTGEPPAVHPGQQPEVRIRIRNISPIPLALGPGAPIDSRLLLTVTLDVGIDRARGVPMMEVVAADRRLRLMPQEALDLTVRPELGSLWLVMNLLGDRSVRLRWRVLQGFVTTQEGLFTEGPMGLTTESGVQLREPLAMATAPAAELLTAIRSGDDATLIGVASALGWRWGAEPERRGLSPEELGEIGAALARRYPGASVPARVCLAAMLPSASRHAALAALEQAMRAERDASALAIVLTSRVTAADDPLLEVAGAHADGRLNSLAGLLRRRLAAGGPTYSRTAATRGPEAGAAPATPPAQAEPSK